jgi:diguanylate cyclase (GGDEF)-like protein
VGNLPLHFRSTDILRGCIQLLRRFVDASTVSLYLPPSSGTVSEPLILHDGDGPPVSELSDLETAAAFSNSYNGEGQQDENSAAPQLLHRISSSSPGGLLIRVSAHQSILAARSNDDGLPEPTRRETDTGEGGTAEHPGIWIGLRLKDGQQPRIPTALKDLASSPEFSQWRDWLVALAAALALHSQQVSAAMDDPVSGVPGRVQFEALLAQAVVTATSRSRSCTLLLVNPDDFDVVNEHFSRNAGDLVIREIADRLTSLTRATDVVHRYGGAIFTVVLPETDLENGTLVAKNLCAKLTEGAYLEGAVRLGFSIGLTEYAPGENGDAREASPELIQKADRALHAAKKAGGGRVVPWGEDVEVDETESLDRLSGIFTANLAKDYRNMLLLWDTVGIISANPDPDNLAVQVVERLRTAFKPDRAALFLYNADDDLLPVAVRTSSTSPGASENALPLNSAQKQLLDRALNTTEPVVYTDEDGSESVVSWAVPLVSQGVRLGCLYLDGGRVVMSLEHADQLFLKALSDQLAAALNHARLAALDRTRQEEQRSLLRAELNDLRRALGQARLVSRSSQMESVLDTIRRVAPTHATVLITGKSGTGKELLARTIHEMSDRKDKPFVVVDCGAIAATLIDSELFGREKGAYTGAEERARGRLAEADGGTVMLDEIGELPVEVQSKLLRFVQEKQITTVGGTRAVQVDVRLIAVTNRDLLREVEARRFREDLYHRLNVVSVESPSLRDRPDDILHIAEHFLNLYSVQYQKSVRRFSSKAEAGMLAYNWPGNVRELQNRVMKAVILSEGGDIDLGALGIDSTEGSPTAPEEVPAIPPARTPKSAPDIPAPPDSTHPRPAKSAWTTLVETLERQIDSAAGNGRRGAVPLGRWLDEDLVREAWEASNSVYSRGADFLGIPETTYRRKVTRVLADAEAGLSPRSSEWNTVRPLLADWLRSDHTRGDNRLNAARQELLTMVAGRIPNEPSFAAALMGVTPVTYRSWLVKHGLD